jgi:RHS repeat-associated protein
LNARYYNPTQGQFTTEDPEFLGNPSQQKLTDPQSLNSYSYSDDNPIVLLDTKGLDSAYFAARSVGNASSWSDIQSVQDLVGLFGAEHNYVSFDINTPASLSRLDIPGVSIENGQANFTLSFEPSNPQAPLNSSLAMELNADLSDAQNYGGSKAIKI